MSDVPQGPGWWQASDDKWYPPPRPAMPGEEAADGTPAETQPFAPPGGPPSGPPGGMPPAAPPFDTSPGYGAPLGGPPGVGGPPGTGPYGVPPQGGGAGNRTPLFVALGVVAAAVLVGLIIVLSGGGDDDPETEETRSTETTSGQSTTTEGGGGGGGGSTTTTEGSGGGGGGGTSGVESVEVVDSGFSMVRDFANDLVASYGFVLENTGSEDQTDLQVSVALYDANDTVVGSGSHTVAILRAGERIGMGDTPLDALSAEVATMEVQVGESGFPATTVPDGTFTVSGISVSSDEYGTEAAFTVESTYSEQVDSPYVYAVFRNAGGDIVGGGFSFLDFVPANGRVAGTVTSYTPLPDASTAEVYVDQGYL